MKKLMNGMAGMGVDRRTVLKGGTAAAATAAFGGGFGMRPASAATSMRYMCWEGYDKESIIGPFEKANDAELSIDLITDSAGGFAKLAAGGYRDFDVVSSDSPWIARMGPAGICEYLDDEEFADAYASFYPQFRAPFAPLQFEGKATGLPTRWGWVGPTVNTKFDKLETWSSYDPCFDPAYKDKICVLDWGDWPIMPMALHAGINPYKELDDAELKEIRKVLRALFKNTRALVGDLSVAQKGLMDGSFRALIGGGTYCTSALRKDGNDHIMSIVPEPKDGLNQGIIWMEATGVLKGTDNPDLAKDLVRHMVSPEVSVDLAWTEATCNLVPSQDAEDLFSDEQKSVLQMDYMWEAWDKSQFHDIAPNVDEMLAIFQEELAAAN
ncbi:extracellular solute-binding protein [Marivibrio halodurans]|uniref:Extracellular solute-binding protein n=1 Tax=Marivibrio halodurans TaxID=2039722 RepID=A0A8J7SGJ7_9PROT|nr:extracellular solute-binding protein [Marivibrio halodurans]MBP5855773.1 extracellular solute-binding protein [Marivibrio halodurans]